MIELTAFLFYFLISVCIGRYWDEEGEDGAYFAVFWPIITLQWFTRNLIAAIFNKSWWE